MTSLAPIDLSTAYEDESAAAPDKVSASHLDADHLAIEEWINAQLLPMLARVIRDDDTLVDYLVRKRNLHPEIWGELTAGLGSVPLAVPADYSVTTLKVALLAITTALLADAAVTTAKLADLNVTTGKLADGAVTNAKAATMATARLKGRVTAGTGSPEDLTSAQATSLLDAFTGDAGSGGLKGVVPAPGSGDANKVLTGAGSWSFLPFLGHLSGAAEIAITAATTATINRMHLVSGTAADYAIPMPAVPAAGDVVGFRVKDWTAANKQFTLDAGAGIKIAGRTRYLVILHTNVVLLRFNGTDWEPLVLNLDTPVVKAPIQFLLTTTPASGVVYDACAWRRVGGCISLHYALAWGSTAGSAGAASTELVVPIGSIDPVLAPAALIAGLSDQGYYSFGTISLSIGLSATITGAGVVRPFSTTTIGATYLKFNTTGPTIAWETWNSSSSFRTDQAYLRMTARAELPMLNW